MIENTHNEEPPAVGKPRFSWKMIPIFLITGVVVYAVFASLSEPEEVLLALEKARWQWLAAAIATLVVLFSAVAQRFRLVLRSLGYEITLFESFDAIIATYPFAVITPSKASDLLRAVALRDKVPAIECSSAVIAERLVDVQALCVLGVIVRNGLALVVVASSARSVVGCMVGHGSDRRKHRLDRKPSTSESL